MVDRRKLTSRTAIKRSKTFTGCWTCRSRGVKCDEQKPVCLRCQQAKVSCGGYGVRLVWEDEREEKRRAAQRRVLFDGSESRVPVLSDKELDSALETLESRCGQDCSGVGPFTVFSLLESSDQTHSWGSENEAPDMCIGSSLVLRQGTETPPTLDHDNQHPPSADSSVLVEGLYLDVDDELPFSPRDVDIGLPDLDELLQQFELEHKLFHFIGSIPPPLPVEERQLTHHWVTFLSGLMIPTVLPDNPFQTVYIPLALSAAGTRNQSQSSSQAALLHSIYAIAAFHLARLSGAHGRPDQDQHNAGTKHLQRSLQYLQQSLVIDKYSSAAQEEAVLATIITLSVIEVINGHSSSWRHHVRGGRNWLRSHDRMRWKKSKNASTLYQIFLFVEALGASGQEHLQEHTAGGTRPDVSLDEDSDYCLDSIFGVTGTSLDDSYRLDILYGITKPVLESIVHINQLVSSASYSSAVRPSERELESLELKIVLNNPAWLRFPSNNAAPSAPWCEDMIRHNACAFYYAAHIHFKRALRHEPPQQLQHLVRKGLTHLSAIHRFEERHGNVCSVLWPLFIISCEAEDEDLRSDLIGLYSKGKTRGIGSICSAIEVVQEV